jgi:transposase-like protein
MVAPRHPRYAHHRFPAEVVIYAIWLYFRFPLSLHLPISINDLGHRRDRESGGIT